MHKSSIAPAVDVRNDIWRKGNMMWKELVLLLYLAVLGLYDIRFQRLPMRWMLMGTVLAIANILWDILHVGMDLGYLLCLIRGWIPGLILLVAWKSTGKIGCGDGWALMIVGSFLGQKETVVVFMASLMFAAIIAGGLLLLRKADRKAKLPYIPFLAVAVILCGFG